MEVTRQVAHNERLKAPDNDESMSDYHESVSSGLPHLSGPGDSGGGQSQTPTHPVT